MGIISNIFNSITISVLIFYGVYLTVSSNFAQIRSFPKGALFSIKNALNNGRKSVKSMLLSLGGTVGVGNIAGVSTALSIGGAGSLFWMWICGLLGMIIKYSEVYIAVRHSPKGPFSYIERSSSRIGKALSIVFSVSCIISSLVIGNAFQVKSTVDSAQRTMPLGSNFILILIALPIAVLILGKGNFIKSFSSVVVPLMSLLYCGFTVYIIFINVDKLPNALLSVLKGAFGLESAAGGVVGHTLSSAISEGVSKGLFSHEAGIGSAPISYAADGVEPVISGYLGMFEVFADMLISTLTAFSLIVSGNMRYPDITSAVSMFGEAFGRYGAIFLILSVYFFCISSAAGWLFYGKNAVKNISENRLLSVVYSLLFILTVFISPYISYNILWLASEISMSVMCCINIYSLLPHTHILTYNIGDVNNANGYLQRVRKKMQREKK